MPHRLSLTAMASAVRERRLSPVELVDAHLRRIERLRPALNPFVLLLAEQARAAARRAQESLSSGASLGPLHGVPVTVKDSFHMEGLPTLCGSRLRLDHRAAADSTAVARLRAAGAIVLGKTNCPEFLANYETDNFVAGRTNNPWNFECTSGGSSGGEAAAIASFCSAGGIGSDGGGSIRVPAHFCGITGLKPTPGRVSAAGHFPVINHPGGLLGVAGPMARDIADLKVLFEVLAGYDSEDPFSVDLPLRIPGLDSIRIGLMERFYRVPVQPPIRATVHRAARLLATLGFPVEPFEPKGLERAPNVWSFFFTDLAAPFTRELLAGREAEAHWTGTEFYEKVKDKPEPTGRQVVEQLAIRDRMRASLLRQMRDCPVLLAPACGVVAFPHRARRYETGEKPIGLFEAMMPLTFVNLLSLPALVLPMMTSEEGLPVGVQLIGRPFDEERLLELALRLEEARGPFPSPPDC